MKVREWDYRRRESRRNINLTFDEMSQSEGIMYSRRKFLKTAGAAAAVDFLASLSEGESRRERLATVFAELRRRAGALVRQLWEGLSQEELLRNDQSET